MNSGLFLSKRQRVNNLATNFKTFCLVDIDEYELLASTQLYTSDSLTLAVADSYLFNTPDADDIYWLTFRIHYLWLESLAIRTKNHSKKEHCLAVFIGWKWN